MPQVTLTQPTVYEVSGVRLLPGANSVSDADFKKLQRNKLVMADIAIGTLVVSNATTEPAQVKSEPVTNDAGDLVALAQGDGRKAEVKDARATLEEMGIDWNE